MHPSVYHYQCQLVRVTDADTVVMDIDVGFRMRAVMPIRLAGVDAPELRTDEGKAARDWVTDWFEQHPIVRISTQKHPEKYGRWLGTIYRDDGSLNQDLIAAGHAVAYGGGARK